MNREHKAQIRAKVETDLKQLSREIQTLEKELHPIAPDCSLGDLGRFELMHEQDILQKRLELAMSRQVRLNNALAQIDRPDFGHCTSCDDEIAFERLMLLPESKLCIVCAEEAASS